MTSRITKSNLLSLGLLSLLVLQCGCYVRFRSNAVQGSGIAETQKRLTDDFSSVKLSGVGTVELEIGSEPSVEITFDDNLLEIVETRVEDGELSITSSEPYNSKLPLLVKVVTPTLEKVVLSGVGSMNLSGLDSDELEVIVSGVGNMAASGKVRNLNVKLSGTGKANLEELVANSVLVSVSGVGNAKVYAVESVDAKTSGVGGITIYGNPQAVNTSSSGIGKINLVK